MTNLERQIKQLILRMLLAADPEAMTDDSLREGITTVYSHIAFVDDDLTRLIEELKKSGIIAGTNDTVFGLMWNLTVAGKNAASQLK
jgi:hypothetical protein